MSDQVLILRKMDSPRIGLWITSVAVAVAAAVDPQGGPYRTGFVLALCLVFHSGITLMICGVSARRGRRQQQ